MAGSHNDITVLRHSHIFNDFIRGRMPNVPFIVNGSVYLRPYYLTDGIYPRYAALMQSIPHPYTPVEQVFARTHESVRKDVERAFDILQAKWGITKGPIRYYKTSELKKIMLTCIILHNMIIDDERHIDIDPWMPLSDEVVSAIDTITTPEVLAQYIHSRMEQIRDDQINASLKMDLMAYIWSLHGNLQI
ncbi:uncharacterized protein LOC119993248 [Tripterygium wilfordii]|uniref:uncharacterized protein LOC119993248 n=1 Tax=Tripterygium wilfordii TaxID=458696 RepID=UPI0018F7ECC0|nr:uncharacterized protein LOC119993248 [Tripterygium wilfordii]